MQKSNAAGHRRVASGLIDESAMKASDFDRQEASLPETPSDREWLRVVGAGVALVLVCAIWTFWA
jgi:hypothetical protein